MYLFWCIVHLLLAEVVVFLCKSPDSVLHMLLIPSLLLQRQPELVGPPLSTRPHSPGYLACFFYYNNINS